MRITFHVKVDNCALVAEDAAATVADKLALLYGSPDVFLGGGAMQAEHGGDLVGRCAAMRFHQLDNLGDEQGAFFTSFGPWHDSPPPPAG